MKESAVGGKLLLWEVDLYQGVEEKLFPTHSLETVTSTRIGQFR